MAARQPLNDDERRLLRITARMPLASVANLAPVLGLDEEKVRRMLGALRRGGWVTSLVRGHDRTQAAPLVPDPPGRGSALRHRPPAPCPQGGGKGRRPGRPPSRGRAARGLPGAFRPRPRPPGPPGGAG